MTREELDRATRILAARRTTEHAVRNIDRMLALSPRASAQDQLKWLEERALAGELAQGGPLEHYDVTSVLTRAYGPPSRTTRR